MNIATHIKTRPGAWKPILIAGLCGGMAEIIWVALYGTLTGHNSAEVARQVTASLLPGIADTAFAPGIGVAIHMALSLLIALTYATLIWRPYLQQRGPVVAVSVAAAALVSLWAINFLLILPIVNPAFVGLLPYAVTLGSKILFGLAMAGVFYTAQYTDVRSAGRRMRGRESWKITV